MKIDKFDSLNKRYTLRRPFGLANRRLQPERYAKLSFEYFLNIMIWNIRVVRKLQFQNNFL